MWEILGLCSRSCPLARAWTVGVGKSSQPAALNGRQSGFSGGFRISHTDVSTYRFGPECTLDSGTSNQVSLIYPEVELVIKFEFVIHERTETLACHGMGMVVTMTMGKRTKRPKQAV